MKTVLPFLLAAALWLNSLPLVAQLASFDKSYALPFTPTVNKFKLDGNGGSIAVYLNSAIIYAAFPVVRFDRDGNVLWQKYYENQQLFSTFGRDVVAMNNGDYVIAFSGMLPDFTTPAVGLVRIGSTGTILWEKVYTSGSTTGKTFSSDVKLAKASDESLYLSVADLNTATGPQDDELILFRFSGSGNLIWTTSFGATPLQVDVLSAAANGGLNLAVTNTVTYKTLLMSVDSSGTLTSSILYNSLGFCTALHTDGSGVVKAMLTTDFLNTTQLIELDAAGNVTNAQNATGGTNMGGEDLMYYSGVYISGHQGGLNGTSLCNWSATPSMQNGLTFTGTVLFTAFDFEQAADGSIYMFGITQNNIANPLSVMVKTDVLSGVNLPLTNCSQGQDNFTITQAIPFSWAPVSPTLAGYTPVVQASGFQLSPVTVTVTNNCSLTSVSDVAATEVGLSPNPANDVLVIEGQFAADAVAQLYTLAGQQLALPILQRTNSALRADVSSLPAGVYLLRLMNTNGTLATAKVVVAH